LRKASSFCIFFPLCTTHQIHKVRSLCPLSFSSFFILPEAKQKHTHSLLQKGFFRRAAVLSAICKYVHIYTLLLAFTLAATRKFTPCVLCVICRPLERESVRAHTHMAGEEMKGQWCKIPCRPRYIVGQDDENYCRRPRIVCASSGKVSANMVTWERRAPRVHRQQYALHPISQQNTKKNVSIVTLFILEKGRSPKSVC
jgi:hypothetical protein